MNIPISNKILDEFSLKNHQYLPSPMYYDLKSGEQEYRLYSYLSTFFTNITILDIGTLNGRSAVALSHNETNTVLSYDIEDHVKNPNHSLYSKRNIRFNIKNVLEDLNKELIEKTKIVMIDIDHYGTVELEILDKLKELNFSGIVLLDDITKHPDPKINRCMKTLWNSVQETKYDFTKYGHWSGTGVIVMNDTITFSDI